MISCNIGGGSDAYTFEWDMKCCHDCNYCSHLGSASKHNSCPCRSGTGCNSCDGWHHWITHERYRLKGIVLEISKFYTRPLHSHINNFVFQLVWILWHTATYFEPGINSKSAHDSQSSGCPCWYALTNNQQVRRTGELASKLASISECSPYLRSIHCIMG